MTRLIGKTKPEIGTPFPSSSVYFIDYAYIRSAAIARDHEPPYLESQDLIAMFQGVGTPVPEMGKLFPLPGPGDLVVVEKNIYHHDLDGTRHAEFIAAIEARGARVMGISLNAPKTALWKQAVEDKAGKRDELARVGLRLWLESDSELAAIKTKGRRETAAGDLNAVEAIRAAYYRGAHLVPLRAPRPAVTDLQKFHRVRTGGMLTSTHPWVVELLEGVDLPDILTLRDRNPNAAEFFYRGTAFKKKPSANILDDYCLEPLIVCVLAAKHSTSSNDFVRRMGLYDHALRRRGDEASTGTFRSAVVGRMWIIAKRWMKAADLDYHDAPFFEPGPHQAIKKLALSRSKLACKVMYHIVNGTWNDAPAA